MATTTPNFGWPVPTSTDLVKDGATAMEALGDAIDTSMVDLKGGTTGQVLAKASNTDMDFTWVTDAAGDITGVTAGVGISGGGTSGTVTVTNSMATAIDAKGDLVPGTGADTFARLAVGANGTVLTADSAEATGLKWASPGSASFATGYNYVATSQSTTSTSFTGLTTAGAVTLTTGTKVLVSISATFENAAGVNVLGLMGFAISGATTVAASDQYAHGFQFVATGGGNFQYRSGATFVVTGLTAGSNTFTTQFRKGGGDTPGFANRTISVVDLGS